MHIKIGVQIPIVVLSTTPTMINSDQDGEFNNTIMDALTKYKNQNNILSPSLWWDERKIQ